MKILIPIILLLVGSSVGVGAGIFLRPSVPEETAPVQENVVENQSGSEIDAQVDTAGRPSVEGFEYVRLSNQFVIPIVREDEISSMVVASLSLEVAEGYGERVLNVEPKIRNEFLRVMFDHANIGGFDGAFTEIRNLETLQTALREVAQKTLGADIVSDVLIFEIARQDY
jgi:hypothetical protein